MAMASAQRYWTLEEFDALPDDGNRYELIHGELFVSPAAALPHELIIARLRDLLIPYAKRERLGYVFGRGVIRSHDSSVEPDLTVVHADSTLDWTTLPVPSLVVEVHSPRSRKYDTGKKRNYYLERGMPEYWLVDGKRKTITVVRPGVTDSVITETMSWHPHSASEALVFAIAELFA